MAKSRGEPGIDRSELRRIAREAAEGRATVPAGVSPGDVQRLLHELAVYQEELLAQNEELHESRAALEAARDRYWTLYEFAPVGYLTLQADGTITAANLPACELLGTARAALVGANLSGFVLATERDGFHAFWRDTAGQETVRTGEFALQPAGRDPVHVHLEARPVESADGRLVLAALTDVSVRKRLEEELREASAAKSRFLANMSHEIRTPLGGVLGMAEVLRHTALAPEQRECVEAIRLSGKLLLGVVNDVLDLSRIEKRGVSLETTAFSLRALVEDTVHLLAESAQSKGLELCCRVGPQVPEQVVGDPGRVRQVLFNLVGNAVKFTDQGRVVVRVERAEARGEQSVVRIAVEDTGIGIPEAAQGSLFEIFGQGDPTTPRRFGGSGLGLAITQRLVAAMGGQIGFQSQTGVGSQFWCTLPFAVLADAPEPQPLAGDVRALVVQSPPTSRAFLVEQLQRLGITVTEAATGEAGRQAAARAAAAGQPFPLAFIDLDLPCGDGRALARELDGAGRSIAVVLLVPFTERGLKSGREGDGWSVLLKPVREADLAATVQAALTPEAPVPVAAPARPLAPQRGLRQAKILMAEDDPPNQQVMVHFLSLLGQEVDVVEDGAAAVTAALAQPYDLVFLDWQMPRLDGVAAAREIRRRETPGRRVPLVALTAHALAEYRDQALAAGMDEFLTKPVDLEVLAVTLARWLDASSSANSPPPAVAPDVAAAASREAGMESVAARLQGLLARLPPEKVGSLIQVFLTQTPVRLAALQQALAAGDAPAVAHEAHALRESLSQLGSARAAELAGLLEQRGETDHLDGADVLLAELQRETDRVRAFLEVEKRRTAGSI